jgi:hypothetical protein
MWRTKNGYFPFWFDQPGFLFQAAVCLFESSFYIKLADGNVHLQNPAILWIVASFSWFALTLPAAYERHKAVWNAISDLTDCIPMLSHIQTRLVDAQGRMADLQGRMAETQGLMAEAQGLMLEKDALEKRLAEVQKVQEHVEPVG